MKTFIIVMVFTLTLFLIYTCTNVSEKNETNNFQTKKEVTAKNILGNPDYLAISYGGYRENTREVQPTLDNLKEDMKILFAMGIRILRTYNTHYAQAGNLLQAIRELKNEDPEFEMYVMLGAWIDCKGAFTDNPNHNEEDKEANSIEIARAVEMANKYSDIVKIIAVGNEAMVKWAESYYVQPWVILKWVNHLQNLKKSDELPDEIWITCSDNFASWGGGDSIYHTEDLTKLMKAVDYISLHTYPMHDTHYNPNFWGVTESETGLSDKQKIDAAMLRARDYAKLQYRNVVDYMKRLGINKPVHIGETGWASSSNSYYGPSGSKATDEYKEAIFHNLIREWTNEAGIACFYFEAFDENWKDARNPGGSENHFGLFTIDGKAKYALWGLVDQEVFKGLGRNGKPITKTYSGSKVQLMKDVLMPPFKDEVNVMQPIGN